MSFGPGPAAEAPWTESLRLRVCHLTRYVYDGPAVESFNEARLEPVGDAAQQVVSFDLQVRPAARIRTYQDLHRNRVHYFEVTAPHEVLEVESRAVVQTRADPRTWPVAPQGLEALDRPEAGDFWFDFVNDSPAVPIDVTVRHEARQLLPGGVSDLWGDALRIGRHLHATLRYTPRATTVHTTPAEVLRTRQGVCQDYAHLMLGMCRSVGIPARYVSGYFLNPRRQPGEVEASHAWVEILVPGHGWHGFDPTHNREPDTRYIKLAVGRDYGDIRPLSGTFRGRGTREMVVEVQVTREA